MRDATTRRLSTFHTVLYRLTAGRLGRRLVDNDMLLLTTTGRRSGRPHTVPLLYLRDGERMVVIASYGGRPRPPDWYLNLAFDPRAMVQVNGRRFRVVARYADSAEHALWWRRAVAAYPGYADYQAKTDRVIPVVFLAAL